MVIYDLEKFLLEFGFVKKDEQIAGSLKEYFLKDYFVSIYKLASMRRKVIENKSSDKFKIIFGKTEESDAVIRILPLKGSIGTPSSTPAKIKQTITTTFKEVINYEEVIGESILDIMESIKVELSAEYRKLKINRIIKNNEL